MSTPVLPIPQSTLQWLWRAVTFTEHGPSQTYVDPTRTYTDVCHSLAYNRGLSVRTDVYTHEDGSSALLLCLLGTIPVSFRGAAFSCPVTVWVPFSYPYEGPIIYVTPPPPSASHAANSTVNMMVRPGQHVSVEGKVYHPYLSRWQESSSLLQMLFILCDVFSKEPPIVSRPIIDPASLRPETQSPATPPVPPRPESHSSMTIEFKPSPVVNEDVPPPRPPRPDLHPTTTISPAPQPAQTNITDTDAPPVPPPRPDLPSSSPSPVAPSRPSYQEHGPSPPPLPPKPVQRPLPITPQKPPRLEAPELLAKNTLTPHPSYPPAAVPSTNPSRSDLPYPFYDQPNLPQPQFHVTASSIAAPIQHHESHPNTTTPLTARRTVEPPLHAPTPSKPTTQVSDLLDLLPGADMPATVAGVTSPPPPPPNPHKDALLHNISRALGRHLESSVSQNTSGVAKLQSQASAMHMTSTKLADEMTRLNEMNSVVASNIDILRTEIERADQVISDTKLKSKSSAPSRTHSPVSLSVRSPPPSFLSISHTSGGDPQTGPFLPSIDDLLVPPTVVSKQLYDLVAEERAIQRAIYALQSALVKGRVNIDVWSRITRGLAREAFLKRALVVKAATGAGLEFE